MLVILYALMVVLLLYVMVYFVFSSRRYSRSFYQAAENTDQVIGISTPEMSRLKANNAFLSARLSLVKEDSLVLTVNLSDSTLTLEQKGVVLHTAKISLVQASQVLKRIDQDMLSRALEVPLTVHQSFSTISKTRYAIKLAPSDTSEAVPYVMPDTSNMETICFFYEMDRNIGLDIREAGAAEDKEFKKYNRALISRQSKRLIKDLMAFRVPEFYPVIRIELPEKDARVIYKALPVNPKVALRI